MPEIAVSTTNYVYLRALEMEGTHPNDAGAWLITVKRLEFGEGVPPPDCQRARVDLGVNGVLPPAPWISPETLRPQRSGYYRRLRTTEECGRYILDVAGAVDQPGGRSAGMSLYLFSGWETPPEGVIPMPAAGERPLPVTHFVNAVGFSPHLRRFHFLNWWGPDWGNRGTGYLPYDYFDAYVFECYGAYFRPRELQRKETPADDHLDVRWVAEDESAERAYGFEVRDLKGVERLAWAFVVQREGALEVEELYVRREFRGNGYGQRLADRVREFARAKALPLRLWVPFADSRRESPQTFPALLAIARRLGVSFRPCQPLWAAYYATNEGSGAGVPPEPTIPPRPRSPLKDVTAAIQAAALAAHMAATPPHSDGPPHHPAAPPHASAELDQFPQIGTAAWGQMNKRRAELIRKQIEDGLSDQERAELERLQRLSLAALEAAYPRHDPTKEVVAEGQPQ